MKVWDIDGNNFTDENGNVVTVNGQKAQGSRGHARDNELLAKRNAPTDRNDPNAKAQYVIANERGEIAVTGNYNEPDTITIKDNTNSKVNTYSYRKLTDAEIAAGKTSDGQPIKGLEGRQGPFYVLVSATDERGSLKTRHTEVFQLEVIPKEEVVEEKDENGNITKTTITRNDYRLEQYQGMSGSGRSSMYWDSRARRTQPKTKAKPSLQEVASQPAKPISGNMPDKVNGEPFFINLQPGPGTPPTKVRIEEALREHGYVLTPEQLNKAASLGPNELKSYLNGLGIPVSSVPV